MAAIFNCNRAELCRVHREGVEVFTPSEAARYLGLSSRGLRYKCFLPFAQLGHQIVRFTRPQCDHLKTVLAARRGEI